MTTKQLIEKLKKYPDDTVVKVGFRRTDHSGSPYFFDEDTYGRGANKRTVLTITWAC